MKKNNEAHESTAHVFALFVDSKSLSVNLKMRTLILSDSDIIKRIVAVLRLTVGENVILFDQKNAYACTLDEITKKHIILVMRNHNPIEPQQPELDIVVPLLEREALEEVVYMATVYGARKLYLMPTEKSRKKLTEKDLARLHKIAIAAAEQSKNFHIPEINHIPSMSHVLSLQTFKDSIKLWCDITGTSVLDVLASAKKTSPSYLVIFGPEGDFTHKEKDLLAATFTPVKLSKNVLRARDAAALIMGIIRAHMS